jgi:hypothetical protein
VLTRSDVLAFLSDRSSQAQTGSGGMLEVGAE